MSTASPTGLRNTAWLASPHGRVRPVADSPMRCRHSSMRESPRSLSPRGTAAASARTNFFARSAEVVDRVGGRALLLTSNERIATELRSIVPGHRHAIWPFVPLDPLLPRCRGVIHAGGLGTTALTVSAGVPSAISPCIIDSLWHARRHETLGIGIWIRGDNIDTAVRRLMTDEAVFARA